MPTCKLTAAALADVCARLIAGESQNSIKKLTGMGNSTMDKMAQSLRDHGISVPSRPAPKRGPEHDEVLHQLFATTSMSDREVSAEAGVCRLTVKKSRARFNRELVRAGGDLPRCDCGQYLHHPRLCWVRTHRMLANRGVASVRTLPPETQADVRRRLLAGETARAIAERCELDRAHIRSFLRSFSPEERQQRDLAFRTGAGRRRAALLNKKIAKPHATSPHSDPTYAQIAAMVPRGIDPALRDDMISQAYLDLLEGRLKEDCLADGVKKVRGRMFQAFANPWGNLSLDAALGDDTGRSMIERIPSDVSAFA